MANDPTRLNSTLYTQAMRNWFAELKEHDPEDLRGVLEGLVIVLGLVASRLPAPPPAALVEERFERKVELWRGALLDLLGQPRPTNRE